MSLFRRCRAMTARLLVPALALLVLPATAGAAPAPTAAPPSAPTPQPAAARGVWTDTPVGFASLDAHGLNGTTGGAGGPQVTVSDLAGLVRYAQAPDPYVIRVAGTIEVEPFGEMIAVASNKTIVGAGPRAAIVGGGLHLDQVSNVIVRNLTFRDSYIPGDWDGKSPENDNDAVRMDTAHHVWIDHCAFLRGGDGLVDVRRDSDYVTLSWNLFAGHNKTLGIGWTENVVTKITIHHNWFRGTFQRNPSIDNTEAAHFYNNHLEHFGQYGTMSRGGARVVAEHNHYAEGQDPIVVKDPTAQLLQRGNVFADTWGRADEAGEAFDPAAYYPYTADPARAVPRIVERHAGPVGPSPSASRVPDTLTVALDGSGDFASVGAALDAIPAGHPGAVTIELAPGVYREVVHVWPTEAEITLRGASGDPADVTLTYDLGAAQQKFYGGPNGAAGSATLSVLADDVTLADLTVENAYAGEGAAVALRTVGAGTRLTDVVLRGEHAAEAGVTR
ncbi:pectinesterase family protein [Streptomyces sp. 4N509B]|uniref:pectinesterase family protein n=1 Tax=Streptomyces sp. 4N509B TaxID=3457413 RepID=UPI003FD593CC